MNPEKETVEEVSSWSTFSILTFHYNMEEGDSEIKKERELIKMTSRL